MLQTKALISTSMVELAFQDELVWDQITVQDGDKKTQLEQEVGSAEEECGEEAVVEEGEEGEQIVEVGVHRETDISVQAVEG